MVYLRRPRKLITSVCLLCDQPCTDETVEHLFLSCPFGQCIRVGSMRLLTPRSHVLYLSRIYLSILLPSRLKFNLITYSWPRVFMPVLKLCKLQTQFGLRTVALTQFGLLSPIRFIFPESLNFFEVGVGLPVELWKTPKVFILWCPLHRHRGSRLIQMGCQRVGRVFRPLLVFLEIHWEIFLGGFVMPLGIHICIFDWVTWCDNRNWKSLCTSLVAYLDWKWFFAHHFSFDENRFPHPWSLLHRGHNCVELISSIQVWFSHVFIQEILPNIWGFMSQSDG